MGKPSLTIGGAIEISFRVGKDELEEGLGCGETWRTASGGIWLIGVGKDCWIWADLGIYREFRGYIGLLGRFLGDSFNISHSRYYVKCECVIYRQTLSSPRCI